MKKPSAGSRCSACFVSILVAAALAPAAQEAEPEGRAGEKLDPSAFGGGYAQRHGLHRLHFERFRCRTGPASSAWSRP